MSNLFSYFWDSEVHLNNLAFGVEVTGCIIEIIIAVIAIATFPKDWSEEQKARIRRLAEIFGVVAAIIFLVALVSNRRTSSLQEARLENKYDVLESKSRWRTISPEQTKRFISLTKNDFKFQIWVRMGPPHAETDSFAYQIRGLLDLAGFAETNKTEAIARWPEGQELMYYGGLPDMPSVIFLVNHPQPFPKINFENGYWTNHWRDVSDSHPEWQTGTVPIVAHLIITNADMNSSSSFYFTNGNFVFQITAGADYFKYFHIPMIESDFNAIGITASYMEATNIPMGAVEIFVNPK